VAHELAEVSLKRLGWDMSEVTIKPVQDVLSASVLAYHPLYQRLVPLLAGDHVTLDAGTGFVHTAPDHGPDDFILGLQHQLKPLQLLDEHGHFIQGIPQIEGMFYEKAQTIVLNELKDRDVLLAQLDYEHSYPVCWRHKKPIFYRTTPQWFVGLTKEVKKQLFEAIKQVDWHPHWGADRMNKMIENRPDWCISRQRAWGTPLVLIYDKKTYEIHPNMPEIIEMVAQKMAKDGLEAWFGSTPQDW
jgi:isoleucyl-tRNA synthetase